MKCLKREIAKGDILEVQLVRYKVKYLTTKNDKRVYNEDIALFAEMGNILLELKALVS